MKAIFITYGQSLTRPVEEVLNKLEIRGFTRWAETQGRGSETGEPHYGTHAWPSKNGSVIAIVRDEEVEPLLDALRLMNEQADEQGLSAFVWDVENRL
jgi:nitrogen regulatory protein PII